MKPLTIIIITKTILWVSTAYDLPTSKNIRAWRQNWKKRIISDFLSLHVGIYWNFTPIVWDKIVLKHKNFQLPRNIEWIKIWCNRRPVKSNVFHINLKKQRKGQNEKVLNHRVKLYKLLKTLNTQNRFTCAGKLKHSITFYEKLHIIKITKTISYNWKKYIGSLRLYKKSNGNCHYRD